MQRLPLVVLAVAAAAAVSCKQRAENGGSRLRNIYGDDDRVRVTGNGYPFAAIGRLEKRDGFCTATLVGPSLVVTAAHCLIDDATGLVSNAVQTYRVNFALGQAKTTANIKGFYFGTRRPVNNRKRDWAFIKLDKRLDGEIRPLKMRAVDFSTKSLPYKMSSTAFHFDNGGGLILFNSGDNCGIRNMDSRMAAADTKVKGRVYHDCDMVAGASGAPMYVMDNGEAWIEAINTSESKDGQSSRIDEYTDANPNYAIPLQDAVKAWEALLAAKEEDVNLGKVKINGVQFSRLALMNAANCIQFQAAATGGQPGQPPSNAGATPTFVPVTGTGKQVKTTGATAGLTQDQCQTSLRAQANGIVCGPGKPFAMIRAGDAQVIGAENAFNEFEDCTRTAALATQRFVCSAAVDGTGAADTERYFVYRMTDLEKIGTAKKLNDCLTEAERLDALSSRDPGAALVTSGGRTVSCEKDPTSQKWGPMFDSDFAVKASTWDEETCKAVLASAAFGYVCIPCKTDANVDGTRMYVLPMGAAATCTSLSPTACMSVSRRAQPTGVCAPRVGESTELTWYVMNSDGTTKGSYETFQQCLAVLN